MRFGLWKYTFLIMQKYGHDESVPYAGGMFVGVLRIVRHIIIIYITHHRNSSATLSQTVHNIIANRPQHHRKPSTTSS